MFNPTPGKPDEPQASPSTPNQKNDAAQEGNIPDEAYTYALECLLKGSKPSDVRRSLLDAGYTQSQADEIIQVAVSYRNNSEANAHMSGESRQDGSRNMMIGGIICLVGIVITFGTLMSASGGGRYVIAWGAIIFGGIQFFRGLAQSKS